MQRQFKEKSTSRAISKYRSVDFRPGQTVRDIISQHMLFKCLKIVKVAETWIVKHLRTPERLTDDTVVDLPALGTRYEVNDAEIPGLHIRVTPTGKKSWSLMCRSPRTRRSVRLTLGRFPICKADEARALAVHVLRAIKSQQCDPKVFLATLKGQLASKELKKLQR